MSLYFLFSYFLFFDFSFFIHMEIIKKRIFIPFPLKTLTSEESTLEFYDIYIYDTSFLKELDDFSDIHLP